HRVYGSSPSADDPEVVAAVQSAVISGSRIDPAGKLLPVVATQTQNAWRKQLLFPVGKPGSDPLGVLLITLDLGYLLKTYQQIKFGPTGVIHIMTHDGREVMEWRPEGLVVAAARGFSQFARQKERSGSLITNLFRDGDKYLSSFQRAERFTFLLVVSR